MPQVISPSNNSLKRLRTLVEQGRGIEAHKPGKWNLLETPPALGIDADYSSEKIYPRIVDFGSLRKNGMGQ